MKKPPLPSACRGQEHYLITFRILLKQDVHVLIGPHGYFHTDVIRLDRKFSSSPVYQGHQLDGAGSAEIHYRVEGGSDGSAGEDDIIDQDNDLSFNGKCDVGFFNNGILGDQTPIIPVEGYIQGPGRYRPLFPMLNDMLNPIGKIHPSGMNADNPQIIEAVIPFQNLQGDSME